MDPVGAARWKFDLARPRGNVEFIRTWTDQFDDWSIRAERFIDVGGDQVVLLSHQTATGRESGVPVELKLWQVADIKDGRLIRITIYFTEADALEAAGLRK